MAVQPSHSLRTRLLWLLLAAIVLTAVVQALIAYRAARAEADEIFDYHMQQMALSLRAGLPVSGAGVPGEDALAAMVAGFDEGGERLSAKSVALRKSGGKTAGLEVVLDEGKNRQIRRLAKAAGFPVLRLVRVAIGGLALGELPKGGWRRLSDDEAAALRG